MTLKDNVTIFVLYSLVIPAAVVSFFAEQYVHKFRGRRQDIQPLRRP